MPKYKLKIRALKFISVVDRPAQEHAVAAIIKGANADQVTATFRMVKTMPELGVILGWALCATAGGVGYTDLQGDQISEDDLVKTAMEYAEAGGAVDEQHDGVPDAGRAVFVFPMTSEIAASLGIATDKTGLLAGIKVTPEVLARFKSGELTGFSIAGEGERTPMSKSATVEAQLSTALAENARLKAELDRARDPRLDAVLAKTDAMIAMLGAAPTMTSQTTKSERARTREEVEDDLEQLYEQVADRRGLGKTEAVRWLLGAEAGTMNVGRRYRALVMEHRNIKPTKPRATIDHAPRARFSPNRTW